VTAQTEALTITSEVGDELGYCPAEGSLLLRGETVPITPE